MKSKRNLEITGSLEIPIYEFWRIIRYAFIWLPKVLDLAELKKSSFIGL